MNLDELKKCRLTPQQKIFVQIVDDANIFEVEKNIFNFMYDDICWFSYLHDIYELRFSISFLKEYFLPSADELAFLKKYINTVKQFQ